MTGQVFLSVLEILFWDKERYMKLTKSYVLIRTSINSLNLKMLEKKLSLTCNKFLILPILENSQTLYTISFITSNGSFFFLTGFDKILPAISVEKKAMKFLFTLIFNKIKIWHVSTICWKKLKQKHFYARKKRTALNYYMSTRTDICR